MSSLDDFFKIGLDVDMPEAVPAVEALMQMPMQAVLNLLAEDGTPPLMMLGGQLENTGRVGGMLLIRCKNPGHLSILLEFAKKLLEAEADGLEVNTLVRAPEQRFDA